MKLFGTSIISASVMLIAMSGAMAASSTSGGSGTIGGSGGGGILPTPPASQAYSGSSQLVTTTNDVPFASLSITGAPAQAMFNSLRSTEKPAPIEPLAGGIGGSAPLVETRLGINYACTETSVISKQPICPPNKGCPQLLPPLQSAYKCSMTLNLDSGAVISGEVQPL
jgi:hypothetical protein